MCERERERVTTTPDYNITLENCASAAHDGIALAEVEIAAGRHRENSSAGMMDGTAVIGAVRQPVHCVDVGLWESCAFSDGEI